MKVGKEDKYKDAFVFPFGCYKFELKDFGVCIAQTIFSRLIDKFRPRLHDVFALSYLDDIIVLFLTFKNIFLI